MALVIESSWSPKTYQLKGQTHGHTTVSGEGFTLTPAEYVQWYKDHGYDFVNVSEWLTATQHDLTPDPEIPGIIFMVGSETSQLLPDPTIGAHFGHIVAINYPYYLLPYTTMQATIDTINAGGGVANLCHPGIEPIPPGGTTDIGFGDIDLLWNWSTIDARYGYPTAPSPTETIIFEYALRNHQNVYPYAVDDVHTSTQLGYKWVMVNVDEKTPTAIAEAIRAGNFYPSQRPVLTISYNNTSITVTNSMDVNHTSFTWRKYGNVEVQSDTNVSTSTYTPVGDEKYVYCEVVGAYLKGAWTPPFYISAANIIAVTAMSTASAPAPTIMVIYPKIGSGQYKQPGITHRQRESQRLTCRQRESSHRHRRR